MRLRKKFVLIFLFLFSIASHSNSFAADAWIRVKSKNFELIGNASDKNIRKVASKLEQFREVFRSVFKKVNFNSPIPTTVIVFKSDSAYKPFKPLRADGKTANWIAGYFQPGEDVNYVTLSTEVEMAETYRIIFHEYIHFLVENNLGESNVPPWFNEGLAEYYETFAIEEDQKVTLGIPQGAKLELLQNNKLIPFDTFFNVSQYGLRQQGQDGVGLFYAQAWALMHYLIQGNGGARNVQLGKFLELVLNGKEPRTAFSEAFQTDYKTMEAELKKYVSQNSYRVSKLTFNNKLTFETEMKTSPLTAAEADAYLGDLLYHTHRYTDAEVKLKEAIAANPASAMALTSLGLVKMRQKDFAAAKRFLEQAIAADSGNYLAHYNYAYVLSREGMSEYGFVSGYLPSQSVKMRAALDRAIELNPSYAESYSLYAFVNLVQNFELDEAEKHLRKALDIAPGNSRYLIFLADLYLRKEDFTKARVIAQRLAATAGTPSEKVYAENTLQRINTTEQQLNEIRNSRRLPPNAIEIDSSMTEEQIEAAREKAILQALAQAIRKPKPDEMREIGVLNKIECKGNDAVFHINAGERTLKLRSDGFDTLELMSFNSEVANVEIGCGVFNQQSNAIFTYRIAKDAKSLGEIVSIEFVPKKFTLSK